MPDHTPPPAGEHAEQQADHAETAFQIVKLCTGSVEEQLRLEVAIAEALAAAESRGRVEGLREAAEIAGPNALDCRCGDKRCDGIIAGRELARKLIESRALSPAPGAPADRMEEEVG